MRSMLSFCSTFKCSLNIIRVYSALSSTAPPCVSGSLASSPAVFLFCFSFITFDSFAVIFLSLVWTSPVFMKNSITPQLHNTWINKSITTQIWRNYLKNVHLHHQNIFSNSQTIFIFMHFFVQFFKNLPKTDICWKRSVCSCLVSASKSVQKTAAEISKSDSQRSQPRSSRKKLEKRLWRTRNWRKWFDWFNFFSWCDLVFCDISTKSSYCSCLHYRFWTHCTVAKLRPHVFIPPHDITLWVWSFHLLINPYLTQGPPPVS